MKKILFLSTLCLELFLVSCGNSSSKNEEEEKITVTSSDGKEYTSYREACRAGDFESAHKFLDILYNEYVEGYGSASDYQSHKVREVREKYHAALNDIFKQEMMFLASDGSEQASDKIIYLLTEVPMEGSPHPEGKYNYDMIGEIYHEAKDHVTYCKYVSNFNNLCNKILDLAISQNNQYLAKKVITMYLQNVENEDGERVNSATHYYYVKYTWADKEKAVAKCKEAGINLK